MTGGKPMEQPLAARRRLNLHQMPGLHLRVRSAFRLLPTAVSREFGGGWKLFANVFFQPMWRERKRIKVCSVFEFRVRNHYCLVIRLCITKNELTSFANAPGVIGLARSFSTVSLDLFCGIASTMAQLAIFGELYA